MKKKTELCKNWEQYGRCKFGKECAFAHGEHELVSKNHVPENYKTKMCKQFHEEGYCPYGNRCQFLHLVIQKDIKKFSYCDILNENIYQYLNRSRSISSNKFENKLVNHINTKRLKIFEEICPETTSQQNRKKSDNKLEN